MSQSTIIDTRDLIDELESLRETDSDLIDAVERDRMAAIESLIDELGDEARYGVALIPEYEFVDYAREFAEDIGAMPEGNAWPTYCIDWEYAARELRMDYTSVRFYGVDYLCRV